MKLSQAVEQYVQTPDFCKRLGLEDGGPLPWHNPLTPLGQGEYNANYTFLHPKTGQRLVLRVNTGSQLHLEDQIGYEFAALTALHPSGRTPRPLFCDGSKTQLPWGVLVMEWLPGRPLCYQTDLGEAAGILADIHATSVPPDLGLLCPQSPARAIFQECLEMEEHYLSWERADPEVCRLLEQLTREVGALPLEGEPPAPRCMVNTELNSGNFLINPSESGVPSFLVDWEKPLLSEPAQDLGHFLAPTTTLWKTDTLLTPQEMGRFVRLYRQRVGGRLDLSRLEERLPLYLTLTCLRGVTWCAMALREYARPDRPLQNQDTRNKLGEYLSPEFLTMLLCRYVRQSVWEESGGQGSGLGGVC